MTYVHMYIYIYTYRLFSSKICMNDIQLIVLSCQELVAAMGDLN